MDKVKLHEILDWCFDALIVLLEQHDSISVKVASAEAAVAALDLIARNEQLEWGKISPRELVAALHAVLRDEDWGTDDERFLWKRTVEELVSMVDSQDYVVELPFISAKGHVRSPLFFPLLRVLIIPCIHPVFRVLERYPSCGQIGAIQAPKQEGQGHCRME
jgi:hypothetical protein